MEWLADPTAWLGLLTLIVLELVLGIDNLVFIAILADKLPPEQRDRARIIGLSLAVLMIAVIISIGLMIVASKPLTRFVNAHPTVIMLCLGFLMMIGFALTAEGLGFHIPKGYLYAAIGFSILIEVFNQIARPRRKN